MRKVCKTVLYVVVILLLGVFSQEETRAGETSERHYSRTYSVLSANVGNSYPWRDTKGLKLQPNSDEERKVISGIKDLKPKPDILILIEAYDRDQVLRICNGTGESYSVHGGPYDFICVKDDIGDVVGHEQMPGGNGNSAGYVDVGLKDEGVQKVRLFYAHFPSPRLKWVSDLGWVSDFGEAEHQAHVSAFGWIEVMLIRAIGSGIPCLIAGDLNNDFIRQRGGMRFWSGKYIFEEINKLNLWIFNPPTDQLMPQLPDGSTSADYAVTYRVPPEKIWKMTIDWAMGKQVVPPFKVPGYRLKIDPVTGTIPTKTIDTCFVTSPPDWWKDTAIVDPSRFIFDHKPLYGKVAFFWEEEVTNWKEYKIGNLYYSVPSDWQVGPEAEEGVSRMYYTDRGHTTFMIGAIDAFKEFEPGKWRIVHYGFDGGKIEELGTTSRTISIGHMGRLVNSFKTEIAGRSVTVCVLRLTEKEGMPVEGEESTNWSFALIKGGKHYAFTLISADSTFQREIFEQLISRIHF